MKSMRRITGILCVLTALLTGYAALWEMLQTINGGPWSWLYPIMLGASILLLVGGVRTFAPRIGGGWLAAFAAAIPLALCAPFGGLPLRCWIFAAVLALATWTCLAIGSAIKKAATVAFIAILVLTASWLPGTMNTFHVYFSPNPPNPNPFSLLPLLIVWAPIFATLAVCGIAMTRSSQA
jgi:hypothetical protein